MRVRIFFLAVIIVSYIEEYGEHRFFFIYIVIIITSHLKEYVESIDFFC